MLGGVWVSCPKMTEFAGLGCCNIQTCKTSRFLAPDPFVPWVPLVLSSFGQHALCSQTVEKRASETGMGRAHKSSPVSFVADWLVLRQ